MDTAIKRTEKIIKLLWWSAFLFGFLLFLYFLIKGKSIDDGDSDIINNFRKKNKNNKHNKLREPIENDETSLVHHPEYLKELKLSPKDKLQTGIAYFSYDDLVKIIETRDSAFFTKYYEAVKLVNEEKRTIYTKLLEKTNQHHSDPQIVNSHDEHGIRRKKERDTYIIILESIDKILDTITINNIIERFNRMLWHKTKGLESLVGRYEFKDYMARTIYTFMKNPNGSCKKFQNNLILGSSGMGKSRLGECFAYAHYASLMVSRYKCTISNIDNYVSRYVNATGGDTRDLLIEHLEGFLILEEIYALTPNKKEDPFAVSHGKDAINVIVSFAEEFTGLSHITAIGYEEPTIEQFIKPNQGMERRFPNKIILKPYNEQELTNIFIRFLKDMSSVNITEKEAKAIYKIIKHCNSVDDKIFDKQAGSMKNIASVVDNIINGATNVEWSTNSDSNIKLLQEGFNSYLKSTGSDILLNG